jgi:hypothetical protein
MDDREVATLEIDREKAIRYVLWCLRSPLALMSPSREIAIHLCEWHEITGQELLLVGKRQAQDA